MTNTSQIPEPLFAFVLTLSQQALVRGDARFSTRKAIEDYRLASRTKTNGNLQRPLSGALVAADPRLADLIERRDTPAARSRRTRCSRPSRPPSPRAPSSRRSRYRSGRRAGR
jgi:hypothetical protein